MGPLSRWFPPETAAKAVYGAVWLSVLWNAWIFATMGPDQLAPGFRGVTLTVFEGISENRKLFLLVCVLHGIALSAARPRSPGAMPMPRRLLGTAVAMLFLSAPHPDSLGPHFIPSAMVLLAGAAVSAFLPVAGPGAEFEFRIFAGTLSAALIVFLGLCHWTLVTRIGLPGMYAPQGNVETAAECPECPGEAPPPAPEQERVRRVRPESIKALPSKAADDLRRAGCTVPQTGFEDETHNFVSGKLIPGGTIAWAALCSRKERSVIRIVWADPGSPDNCADEIAEADDEGFFGVRVGDSVFARRLLLAEEYYTKDRYRKSAGFSTGEPGGFHEGLEDEFVGHDSSIHYCLKGEWITLPGKELQVPAESPQPQ